ncbi:MAG TPA: hypothetical protein VE130_04320 [Nitrososphaeraceae archaeon]|nr:hypothetical protein [Nitrososphaeraceae archaeon]
MPTIVPWSVPGVMTSPVIMPPMTPSTARIKYILSKMSNLSTRYNTLATVLKHPGLIPYG